MDAEPKPGGDDASQSNQSETNFAAHLSAEQSEMLGKFLLAPVPRGEIAPEIRRAARKNSDRTWVIPGVMFLLMSLVFAFLASPVSVLNDWRLDREHREATGFVRNVSVTHYTTRDHKDVYRYEYTFGFTPDNSTEVVVGRCHPADGRRWNVLDRVQIWYLPGNASVARMEGTRLGEPGLLVGALIVFAFGGVFWLIAILSRKRLEWLLANGVVGEFRVTNVVWVPGGRNRAARVRVECERADDKTDDGLYCGALFRQPKNKLKPAQNLKDTGRTVFGLYDPRERERGKERRRLEIPEMWFW